MEWPAALRRKGERAPVAKSLIGRRSVRSAEMKSKTDTESRNGGAARLAALTCVAMSMALAASGAASASGGGVAPGTPPPISGSGPPTGPITANPAWPVSKPVWLDRWLLTEYWSSPERWFRGRKVIAPGLTRPHRIDFLYSATGVVMEGEGTADDGTRIHMRILPSGYVNRRAQRAVSPPAWATEYYWLNPSGEITFPLEAGGWSNGSSADPRGRPKVGPVRTVFAVGESAGSSGLPVRAWRTIAVDPRTVPYRSAVWLPTYRRWFCATDTGGAIRGRHFDVYRPAPATRAAGATTESAKVYVVPPKVASVLYPTVCP